MIIVSFMFVHSLLKGLNVPLGGKAFFKLHLRLGLICPYNMYAYIYMIHGYDNDHEAMLIYIFQKLYFSFLFKANVLS